MKEETQTLRAALLKGARYRLRAGIRNQKGKAVACDPAQLIAACTGLDNPAAKKILAQATEAAGQIERRAAAITDQDPDRQPPTCGLCSVQATDLVAALAPPAKADTSDTSSAPDGSGSGAAGAHQVAIDGPPPATSETTKPSGSGSGSGTDAGGTPAARK